MHLSRRPITLALMLGGVLLMHDALSAFRTTGRAWIPATIPMQLQLGSNSSTLINGCSNWGCAAESALAEWNLFLNRSQFTVARDSTVPIGDGNSLNNVFYSGTVFGEPWDTNTLAVTLSTFIGGQQIETDVLFNSTLNWNGYDGPLRRASGGGTLQDFRRVALHEFGHVLGLDHPDQVGQTVSAIMNSIISDTDILQFDDVLGAYALYLGTVGGANLPFPARNETLAFRLELELIYRDDLGRLPTPTAVDVEGDVVSIQEYSRYRLSGCSDSQATVRVLQQIDGLGVQATCT